MKQHLGIQRTQDFVIWIEQSGGRRETTRAYIAKTFFNNNKDMSNKCIKKLVDAGIVINSRSYSKGRGQVWSICKSQYSIADLFEVTEVTVNEVTVNEVTEVTGQSKKILVNYKGIEKKEVEISQSDFEIAKEGFEMMQDVFSEARYVEHLTLLGFCKFKSHFFFRKAQKKLYPDENN
jgi:hypothetical protein